MGADQDEGGILVLTFFYIGPEFLRLKDVFCQKTLFCLMHSFYAKIAVYFLLESSKTASYGYSIFSNGAESL